jgi:hypothetical protein
MSEKTCGLCFVVVVVVLNRKGFVKNMGERRKEIKATKE